jgi:hypothetical protein
VVLRVHVVREVPVIVERRLGQGDVQHVRDSLLTILLTSPDGIIDQVRGCFGAGEKLQKMARVYIPWSRIDRWTQYLIHQFMYRNQNHQLMELEQTDLIEFNSVLNLCDLVVYGDSDALGTESGIVQTWLDHKGRFAKGNFARLSREELLEQFPQYKLQVLDTFKEFHG